MEKYNDIRAGMVTEVRIFEEQPNNCYMEVCLSVPDCESYVILGFARSEIYCCRTPCCILDTCVFFPDDIRKEVAAHYHGCMAGNFRRQLMERTIEAAIAAARQNLLKLKAFEIQ
jgi:hypothetical protein